MKLQKFFDEVVAVLKKDKRFVSESGELMRNAVYEAAMKMDERLLKLLYANAATKKAFFKKVGSITIFDKQEFGWTVSNEEFLPDSYTRFRNKIGLANENGEYLSSSRDIELVFPYKDCILEGGQTFDDEDRDEVFYSTALGHDALNRLLDPKVFTNPKRYEDGSEKLAVGVSKKDNLIIRGNNLLALYSLVERFEKSIQCIFIDPPFNTGSDGFNYNDKFNHSSWLTFMKNRLEVAHRLLKMSGVMCVDIGNEEVHYVRVLLDEIFGKENFVNHITMTTNDPSGFKATGAKIFSTSNHLLIYARDMGQCELKKMFVPKSYDLNYKMVVLNPKEDYKKWKFSTVVNEVCKEEKITKQQFGEYNQYEQLELMASYADRNRDRVFRTAAIGGGAKKKRIKTIELSAKKKGIVFKHPGDDVEDFYILNGEGIVFWGGLYRDIDGKRVPCMPLTDVWADLKWTGIAREGGVTLKNGKKPELLLKRVLEFATKENDVVLDFHLGSGTTAAVAHKLNRQWIGIEQLDYGENDSYVRMKNVVDGDKTGISKVVNWKGGGSFVYCELAKSNQVFVERIEKAKKDAELKKIWEEMFATGFISCKLDPSKFSPDDAEYIDLSLKDKKRILMDLLDLNQLYVNYCDMDDKTFKISAADKAFTKSFYEGK